MRESTHVTSHASDIFVVIVRVVVIVKVVVIVRVVVRIVVLVAVVVVMNDLQSAM